MGLIPACAGKTPPWGHRLQHAGAHPRVCGENGDSGEARGGFQGSSPRVRGKRVAFDTNRSQIGLIPACAGKTTDAATITLAAPAHPRVCGENFGGTTPEAVNAWLIPACAGKTIPTDPN